MGKIRVLKDLDDDICSLVEYDCISMSRGAEILEISLMEMRELYNAYYKRREKKNG